MQLQFFHTIVRSDRYLGLYVSFRQAAIHPPRFWLWRLRVRILLHAFFVRCLYGMKCYRYIETSQTIFPVKTLYSLWNGLRFPRIVATNPVRVTGMCFWPLGMKPGPKFEDSARHCSFGKWWLWELSLRVLTLATSATLVVTTSHLRSFQRSKERIPFDTFPSIYLVWSAHSKSLGTYEVPRFWWPPILTPNEHPAPSLQHAFHSVFRQVQWWYIRIQVRKEGRWSMLSILNDVLTWRTYYYHK